MAHVEVAYEGGSGGGGIIYDPLAFVTVWRTTSFNESITLPFDGVNNFMVDWGDGNTELVTTANPSHSYADFGDYIVVCLGVATEYGSTNASQQSKCIDILQFGSMSIINWNNGFRSADLVHVTATDGFSGAEETFQMFGACNLMLTIDLSNCNNPDITSSAFMFDGASNVISINIPDWGGDDLTNVAGMFRGCSDLLVVNLSGWNTSSVNNFSQIFANCTSITTLDVSSFDTSSGVNMSSMFENVESIVTLDLSTFDVSSATSMFEMFNDCTLLENLDVSTWVPSLVTNFGQMFRDCQALNNTDFSSWDTGSADDMGTMFFNCDALSNVDVSGFDVSSLLDAASMFSSSGFSDVNYDLLLIAWSAQTLQPGVSFHAGTAQYSAGAAATARGILTSAPNNWVITDGGPI